jgi:hypothetical protein
MKQECTLFLKEHCKKTSSILHITPYSVCTSLSLMYTNRKLYGALLVLDTDKILKAFENVILLIPQKTVVRQNS